MNLNPVGSSPNVSQRPVETNPSTSMKSPVTEIATKALKGNENRAKSTLGHRFVTWLKSVGAAIRRLFSCCVAKEKGGRLPNPSNPNPNSRASFSDSLPPLVPVTPDPSIPPPPPPPGSNPPPPSGNIPPAPPQPPSHWTPRSGTQTSDSNSTQPSPAQNPQNSAPSSAPKKGSNPAPGVVTQEQISGARAGLRKVGTVKQSSVEQTLPRASSAPVSPFAPKELGKPTPSSLKKTTPEGMKKAPDPKQASGVVLKPTGISPKTPNTSQENMDPQLAAILNAQKAKEENQKK